MTIERRKQRGSELLEKMLGPDQAESVRAAWKEITPDFENYVVEFLAGEIWSRPKLDLRTKSLATISALAAMGRTLALELNIRFAYPLMLRPNGTPTIALAVDDQYLAGQILRQKNFRLLGEEDLP